jgi:hypothetical protein
MYVMSYRIIFRTIVIHGKSLGTSVSITPHMHMHATSRKEASHMSSSTISQPRQSHSLARLAMPCHVMTSLGTRGVYLSLHPHRGQAHWRMPSHPVSSLATTVALSVFARSFLFVSSSHVRQAPCCAPSVGSLAGWLSTQLDEERARRLSARRPRVVR